MLARPTSGQKQKHNHHQQQEQQTQQQQQEKQEQTQQQQQEKQEHIHIPSSVNAKPIVPEDPPAPSKHSAHREEETSMQVDSSALSGGWTMHEGEQDGQGGRARACVTLVGGVGAAGAGGRVLFKGDRDHPS